MAMKKRIYRFKRLLLFMVYVFCSVLCCVANQDYTGEFDLFPEHIPYQLKRSLKSGLCEKDLACPFKEHLNFTGCWGYEKNCNFEKSFSFRHIKCPSPSRWPNAKTKPDQIRLFWHQGDFGYLLDRMKDMKEICSSHPNSVSGFYDPAFGLTWDVFTALPLINLKDLDAKRVCFREAMFPLLARQQLGFYYNMPIVDGCYGSGFFHAFSKHVLQRLNIKQNGPIRNKIRITLLTRTTKYRRMLNEEELIGALKTIVEFEIRSIDFTFSMPFREQLEWSHNSDIFIGMHGSGLTHLLFLPDWAAVFEIYHCEDPNCYRDLAHLRGVYYRSWENMKKLFQEDEGHHPTLGAHAKFTNYAFDVQEFIRIVSEMADHVRSHPAYVAEQKKLQVSEKMTQEQTNSEQPNTRAKFEEL